MFKSIMISTDNNEFELSALIDLKTNKFTNPLLTIRNPDETIKIIDIWDNVEYLTEFVYPFLKGENTSANFGHENEAEYTEEELERTFYSEDIKADVLELFEEAFKIGLFKSSNPVPVKQTFLLTDFNTERWKQIDHSSIQPAIDNLQNRANNRTLLGELGDNIESGTVSLYNVSHIITNLKLIDNKVYGDVEFVDTISGNKAKDIKDPKFYLRSSGRFNDNELLSIESIITWDISEKN